MFTRDISRAFSLMENIEAGIVAVNDGMPAKSQAPSGVVKQSGRGMGIEGLDAFMDTKHVSIGL